MGTNINMTINSTTKAPYRPIGARNGRSRLRAEDVYEVRTSTQPSMALAERFKVSVHTINAVRQGTRWAWLSCTPTTARTPAP